MGFLDVLFGVILIFAGIGLGIYSLFLLSNFLFENKGSFIFTLIVAIIDLALIIYGRNLAQRG